MELKEQIINEIKKIYDPEIPVNIYELGLIYDINIDKDNMVKIKITGIEYFMIKLVLIL